MTKCFNLLKCFILLLGVLNPCFGQPKSDTACLKVVAVYHINENTCYTEPINLDLFKVKGEGITSYKGKEIKPTLNSELCSFLKSSDTLQIQVLKVFNPFFLLSTLKVKKV
jgi:hypothetical protein